MNAKRILIADDEEDICQFLSYYFIRKGYEVRTAHNGIEAIQHTTNWYPDIILTDILMPEMNGISMCRELKKSALTKNIPVIFLSASTDECHLLSAMEAGGTDYMSKPIRLERIGEKVEETILKSAV